MDTGKIWEELEDKGFSVVDNVFNRDEVSLLVSALEETSAKTGNFRVSNDLFAIRQLLNEIPGLLPIIFNAKMVSLIKIWPGED